jgi:ketosteroid isomerase-like protein
MKQESRSKSPLKAFLIAIVLLSIIGCKPDAKKEPNGQTNKDEIKIHQLHSDFVNGWKDMNEEKVMGLMEEESMIQPNRLSPIEGKEKIREFWFPDDGSITTINEFVTEMISVKIMDTIAVSTHHTLLLDWDYVKDSVSMGRIQKGFNTTIYRRQRDGSWKIWRSMWTDTYLKGK